VENFLGCGQLPQTLDRAGVFPQQIAPDKKQERFITRREQGRQGIVIQLLSPG
jgi:hypothetical protein